MSILAFSIGSTQHTTRNSMERNTFNKRVLKIISGAVDGEVSEERSKNHHLRRDSLITSTKELEVLDTNSLMDANSRLESVKSSTVYSSAGTYHISIRQTTVQNFAYYQSSGSYAISEWSCCTIQHSDCYFVVNLSI